MRGLPLLILAVLLVTACQSSTEGLQTESSPAMKEVVGKGQLPGLSDYERRRLQRLGLEEPERELAADLARRPELIGEDPVLGGRMYFVADEIHVLTGRWVLATFEDGHIRGHMLLEYNVEEGGGIRWRPLESYVD